MLTIHAFYLGFIDHIGSYSELGRTWEYNQDYNEAYDKGWNFADFIRRRH